MKIVFTGGGSGGHIFPLIAVVREIKRLFLQKQLEDSRNIFGEQKAAEKRSRERLELYYLGPRDDFSLILLNQEGVKTMEIASGKIRRYLNPVSLLENFVDIFFLVPLGCFQAFFRLFFLAPDLIFSKGGYGSFPVVSMGWILRIPIFAHESDVDPGLSNKLLSKFAKIIFVSFQKTERLPLSKMLLTGNPIRTEVTDGGFSDTADFLKLIGGKPVVLIVGGSQGAQRINDLILAILPDLLQEFEVLHQTGEKNFIRVKAEAEVTIKGENGAFYHPFPFFREEELKRAYDASSLVVGRAGSGIIFEIAAIGKPSILIPLPEAAQNHQMKNAYAYAGTGAAIVLEEANLSPNFFTERVRALFAHPLEMEKMAQAARAFSRPGAAREIAEYLFNYLGN